MAAPRFTLPFVQWIDPTGNVGVGWRLYFFNGDTDQPSAPFADPDLTVPTDNPVLSLQNGYWPNIFLNPAITYKVVLKDADDALIWTAYPVTASGILYPVAFEFLSGTPPLANEVMGMHTFTTDISFPASFLGSAGYILVNPAANLVTTIGDQAGNAVGSMTINPAGGFSFTTANGAPITALAGTTWIQKGPAVADAQAANISWTLAGVLSQ